MPPSNNKLKDKEESEEEDDDSEEDDDDDDDNDGSEDSSDGEEAACVEIHLHERYSMFSGWSSKNLLKSDPPKWLWEENFGINFAGLSNSPKFPDPPPKLDEGFEYDEDDTWGVVKKKGADKYGWFYGKDFESLYEDQFVPPNKAKVRRKTYSRDVISIDEKNDDDDDDDDDDDEEEEEDEKTAAKKKVGGGNQSSSTGLAPTKPTSGGGARNENGPSSAAVAALLQVPTKPKPVTSTTNATTPPPAPSDVKQISTPTPPPPPPSSSSSSSSLSSLPLADSRIDNESVGNISNNNNNKESTSNSFPFSRNSSPAAVPTITSSSSQIPPVQPIESNTKLSSSHTQATSSEQMQHQQHGENKFPPRQDDMKEKEKEKEIGKGNGKQSVDANINVTYKDNDKDKDKDKDRYVGNARGKEKDDDDEEEEEVLEKGPYNRRDKYADDNEADEENAYDEYEEEEEEDEEEGGGNGGRPKYFTVPLQGPSSATTSAALSAGSAAGSTFNSRRGSAYSAYNVLSVLGAARHTDPALQAAAALSYATARARAWKVTANERVAYATGEKRVLFSPLSDGAFAKKYTPWMHRVLVLRGDALLLVHKESCVGGVGLDPEDPDVDGLYHLGTCRVMSINMGQSSLLSDNEVALRIFCLNFTTKIETNFRVIWSRKQADIFLASLAQVSSSHDIELFRLRCKLPNKYPPYSFGDESRTNTQAYLSNGLVGDRDIENASQGGSETSSQSTVLKSGMRMHILQTLDNLEYGERVKAIRNRRGAFKYLPVYFNNDLEHGSWWFVVGSLFITVCSAITMCNTWYQEELLGSDDSILSRTNYIIAWALLTLSGVFFTIGSFVFVRAMSEPPLPPMFTYYHLSTDELVASWLFLIGMLPAIPYTVLFVFTSASFVYYAMLGAAVFGCFATYVFVITCYPQVDEGKQVFVPYIYYFLGKKPWVVKHFGSDWLFGTWMVYYATFIGTFGFLGYTPYTSLYHHSNRVEFFVNATTTIDCFLFLIGSAYFVAGSYPPPANEGDGDDQDDEIEDDGKAKKSKTNKTNAEEDDDEDDEDEDDEEDDDDERGNTKNNKPQVRTLERSTKLRDIEKGKSSGGARGGGGGGRGSRDTRRFGDAGGTNLRRGQASSSSSSSSSATRRSLKDDDDDDDDSDSDSDEEDEDDGNSGRRNRRKWMKKRDAALRRGY